MRFSLTTPKNSSDARKTQSTVTALSSLLLLGTGAYLGAGLAHAEPDPATQLAGQPNMTGNWKVAAALPESYAALCTDHVNADVKLDYEGSGSVLLTCNTGYGIQGKLKATVTKGAQAGEFSTDFTELEGTPGPDLPTPVAPAAPAAPAGSGGQEIDSPFVPGHISSAAIPGVTNPVPAAPAPAPAPGPDLPNPVSPAVPAGSAAQDTPDNATPDTPTRAPGEVNPPIDIPVQEVPVPSSETSGVFNLSYVSPDGNVVAVTSKDHNSAYVLTRGGTSFTDSSWNDLKGVITGLGYDACTFKIYDADQLHTHPWC